MTDRDADIAPVVAILDPCCQVEYAPYVLPESGLGGTEATVIRVIDALSHDHQFQLFQKPCRVVSRSNRVELRPLDDAFKAAHVSAFLVINSWKVACALRNAHPELPISVWLHVFPGRHNRKMGAALAAAKIDIICVSRNHEQVLRHFLAGGPMPLTSFIYNPVADVLCPDATPRDPNRLFFASSPHKGLREIFSRFRELRRQLPALKLFVADPGYLAWEVGPVPENVQFLGRLTHPQVISQMRRSLCLFYPQTTFAETFGLVMAEANAVGTPVLAHQGLGANDEILADTQQLLDGSGHAAIFRRICQWQRTFPRVKMQDAFRLSNVATQWRAKLATDAHPARMRAAE